MESQHAVRDRLSRRRHLRGGTVMKLAAILIATSGCAQLFGLDDTTGTTVDAPGPGAHASFRHASIGTTTITNPYDFTAADKITFLVADASDPTGYRKVTPTIEAPGT